MEELSRDVKEIKHHVIELVKQGAVHNTILKEHERRSLNLETIVLPIQRKVHTAESALKIIVAIIVGVVIQWVSQLF